MRLRTDTKIREVLYGLYVALFQAAQLCPDCFPDGRLTTILTAIMGVENHGWHVVGITREALDLLATNEFRKPSKGLCRGHIVNRIKTARLLFGRSEPMKLDEFFNLFLENDRTVIMLKEQNNHNMPCPDFIPVANLAGELFPNGSLIGWKHRKLERDYLRNLHSRQTTM
jgi:hypothetical protein